MITLSRKERIKWGIIVLLAVVGYTVLTVAQATWVFFGNESIYFTGDVIMKITVTFTLAQLLLFAHKREPFWVFYIGFVLVNFYFDLAIGDCIDEFFFKPHEIEWGEYLYLGLSGLILVYQLFRYKKMRGSYK